MINRAHKERSVIGHSGKSGRFAHEDRISKIVRSKRVGYKPKKPVSVGRTKFKDDMLKLLKGAES